MTQAYISREELRDHAGFTKLLADSIEEASTFTLQRTTATMAAGDFTVGVLLKECIFLGAYIEQAGDEGTDGTITIERWDNVGGSTQTAVSSAATLSAGAAAITTIPALTTTAIYCTAGEKINAVIASCNGAVAAYIVCYFKVVHDRSATRGP